jgi:hypothetical protein
MTAFPVVGNRTSSIHMQCDAPCDSYDNKQMCMRDDISVHCTAWAYTGGRWVAAAGVARQRDLARPHALAGDAAALVAAPARRARAQAGLRLNRWHRQRAQQQQAALDSDHSWSPSPRSSTASSRHPAGAPRLAWKPPPDRRLAPGA